MISTTELRGLIQANQMAQSDITGAGGFIACVRVERRVSNFLEREMDYVISASYGNDSMAMVRWAYEQGLKKEWIDGVVCYRKTALLTGSKQ